MTTATKARTTKELPAIPFAAMIPGDKEWEGATRQMFQTWKQQVDSGFRMIDAIVQGAMEMRTSQLAAAAEAHARDLDTEKSVMGAKTPEDLLLIQINWMSSNFERSMSYWSQMFHAAADANAKLLECFREQSEATAPGKAGDATAA